MCSSGELVKYPVVYIDCIQLVEKILKTPVSARHKMASVKLFCENFTISF